MRLIYLTVGILALGLGFVGAFLPVIPTTPFVLVAAWCFSRSSEKLHAWILNSKIFGRMVRDWRSGGVIRMHAKVSASGLILTIYIVQVYFTSTSALLNVIVACILACVLIFIWSRPSSVSEQAERSVKDLSGV